LKFIPETDKQIFNMIRIKRNGSMISRVGYSTRKEISSLM